MLLIIDAAACRKNKKCNFFKKVNTFQAALLVIQTSYFVLIGVTAEIDY